MAKRLTYFVGISAFYFLYLKFKFWIRPTEWRYILLYKCHHLLTLMSRYLGNAASLRNHSHTLNRYILKFHIEKSKVFFWNKLKKKNAKPLNHSSCYMQIFHAIYLNWNCHFYHSYYSRRRRRQWQRPFVYFKIFKLNPSLKNWAKG